MRILALDLATVTGGINGVAGSSYPRSFRWRLKRSPDDMYVAPGELGYKLRDEFCLERPDLVAVEAPLPFFAEHNDDGEHRRRSFESLMLPPMLVGAVIAIARCYGVRVARYQANTVRKRFLGKMSAGDRKSTKQAVVRQAQIEKLIKDDCYDDNVADAAAVWLVACMEHARRGPRELAMFGEGARA